MSKTVLVIDFIQMVAPHCSRPYFRKGLKLANRSRKKEKKSQSKTDETHDEVRAKGLEKESEEELDKQSDVDNLAEDFEEDVDSAAEPVPDIEGTSKDQAIRTLEVRRAIEERMEQRKLKDDLDYLDEEI